jgi:molybdopterin converting factor small subunit
MVCIGGKHNRKEHYKMKVNLKCFATLVDAEKCEFNNSKSYTLEDGQTVEDLISKAGIKKSDVKLVFVNSKKVGLDAALNNGDHVGLAPAVGGM